MRPVEYVRAVKALFKEPFGSSICTLKSPIINILSVYVTRSVLKPAKSYRKREYGLGGRYRVTMQKEGGGAGVVALFLFKIVGGFMQIISNYLKVFTDFKLRLKLTSYTVGQKSI